MTIEEGQRTLGEKRTKETPWETRTQGGKRYVGIPKGPQNKYQEKKELDKSSLNVFMLSRIVRTGSRSGLLEVGGAPREIELCRPCLEYTQRKTRRIESFKVVVYRSRLRSL